MNHKFLKFYEFLSWLCLIFCVIVIAWGALVRATGSGAGCGNHWPLCNGEALPLEASIKTLIEFTHRTTSGLLLITILLLYICSFKLKDLNVWVKKSAFYSFIFIIIEAGIGAVLVLMKLVENNDSLLRAIVISFHLMNTFFLLASLVMNLVYLRSNDLKADQKDRCLSIGLLLLLIVGMSGALAALGDTLFPATSLWLGFKQDFAADSHFLLRLRMIHPIIAISCILYLSYILMIRFNHLSSNLKKISILILFLLFLQFALGFLNIYLLAPIWLQIVHLVIAQLIWMLYISYILQSRCRLISI